MDQVVSIIITAIVTGAFSSITTVAALKVDIKHLGKDIDRHEQDIRDIYNRLSSIKNGN